MTMTSILELLNFKSTKERDDFVIAVLVILFFGWLFWWLYPGFSSTSIASNSGNTPEAAVIPLIDNADSNSDEVLASIDSDGDGVSDEDDKCPGIAGDSSTGCPSDTDGDGIMDSEDKCPKLKGTIATKGCPMDSDNDGVYDTDDKCPNLAGTIARNGCPEPAVEAEEKRILAEAVQGVEFKTGSAELMRTSRSMLYRIVKIMKKYPDYNIEIVGHTDNTGDKASNLELSKSRAKSCFDYLINNDISADRITYKGYGQKKPIESNDTEEGRSKNRRVEFNLTY